jgi:hypothetical protein
MTLSVSALIGVGSVASAITITTGVDGGSGDVTNVLFNQAGLITSGPIIQGNFAGNGYLVEFQSTSGDLETPSSGQARIEGLGGATFTHLSFALEDGASFTKAQFTVNAEVDGVINFDVFYFIGNSPYQAQMSLDGNGENFFTVLAGANEQITRITFNSSVPISDVRQVRIGGVSRNVPDGGTTLGMMGAALLALTGLQRKYGGARS